MADLEALQKETETLKEQIEKRRQEMCDTTRETKTKICFQHIQLFVFLLFFFFVSEFLQFVHSANENGNTK